MSCLVATGSFRSSSKKSDSPVPPAWTQRAAVTPPGQRRWLPSSHAYWPRPAFPQRACVLQDPGRGGFRDLCHLPFISPTVPWDMANF